MFYTYSTPHLSRVKHLQPGLLLGLVLGRSLLAAVSTPALGRLGRRLSVRYELDLNPALARLQVAILLRVRNVAVVLLVQIAGRQVVDVVDVDRLDVAAPKKFLVS